MSAHTPGPCSMCETETGRHPSGTVARREKCGCDVAGFGLLPNPWHIHKCPLHAAAPRMLQFIKEYARLSLGTDVISEQARAILRDVEGESNG